MDRYSLICTAYDEGGEGWDTEMGTYPTHEAARAAIPAMMAEWDEQLTGLPEMHEARAEDCAWSVWDRETRATVTD